MSEWPQLRCPDDHLYFVWCERARRYAVTVTETETEAVTVPETETVTVTETETVTVALWRDDKCLLMAKPA